MTSALLLTYVERRAGLDKAREVLRRAGAAHREAELRDEASWFSFELKIRLFEAMVEVLDDPQATRKMGEAALDLQVAAGLKVALRALGSPRLLYKNVSRANAKFSARHVLDLLELGSTHARMCFRDIGGGEIHPLDCDYTRGLLACAPGLFGLPRARISHSCRAHEGTDGCVYDITWEPAHTRALVACGAAGTAAIALPALLEPSLLPAGGGAAAAAVALAAAQLVRAWRGRVRRLESELRDVQESSSRISNSLRALVSDLRIDEALENVTSYARQAIGGKEFALLVHESEGMRCQSSSGLPARTIDALERWARTSAHGAEEAVLLDDVGLVPELEGLPHEPAMPLGSLCAAPLVYRGERLGLLVALSPQRMTFLPRDVERLQAYAMQAAIALTNARLYEAQEALATKDALTGLRNHREFHERVGHELERLRRHEGRLAILLLDLDGFKSVNDESGHAAGDRVLRRTAIAIEGACRAADVAFRVGGDEFAIMLPDTGREEAMEVAQRVGAAVDTVDPRTTASFGIAVWPEDGGSKDVLLAHADGVLYAAKGSSGRAPAAPVEGERRLAVANRLAVTLTRALHPADILRITVDELDRSLGYVFANVLRLDTDGMLRMTACAGPLANDLTFDEWEQSASEGVNGRVVRTGRPALVADTSLEPDYLDVGASLRSALVVPIRLADRVWGVLNIEDTRVHAFDEQDMLLVETIAAHVGSALHRAELQRTIEGLRGVSPEPGLSPGSAPRP
jgi:diguanylate cyclase (GGDEF)-like protein